MAVSYVELRLSLASECGGGNRRWAFRIVSCFVAAEVDVLGFRMVPNILNHKPPQPYHMKHNGI